MERIVRKRLFKYGSLNYHDTMPHQTNAKPSRPSDVTPLDQSTLLPPSTAVSWSRFFGLWAIPFIVFNIAMQWWRIRIAPSDTATVEQYLFVVFWWLVGNSLLMVLLVVFFAIQRHQQSEPFPL